MAHVAVGRRVLLISKDSMNCLVRCRMNTTIWAMRSNGDANDKCLRLPGRSESVQAAASTCLFANMSSDRSTFLLRSVMQDFGFAEVCEVT